ncbi:MAG TPA: hypothetical protein VF683_07670 [Chthoniobacterales bacterium]
MKRSKQNAEVIFDREEPVGKPTDLVMPRKRWFRKAKDQATQPANRARTNLP